MHLGVQDGGDLGVVKVEEGAVLVDQQLDDAGVC